MGPPVGGTVIYSTIANYQFIKEFRTGDFAGVGTPYRNAAPADGLFELKDMGWASGRRWEICYAAFLW